MPRFHVFLATVGLSILSACSVPPAEVSASSALASSAAAPSAKSPTWGPDDLCAETVVVIPQNTRTVFSLAAENVRNDDYCAAYPYLKWLLANDPLFTGEDPDDRNFLRMARVYEQFALAADSSERRVWLDSALAVRQQGREAMDAAGIEYESYLRDLVEGFLYVTHADVYENAERLQYEAFKRAFAAQPDSIDDWYLGQLLIGSELEYGSDTPTPDRAAFVERLAFYLDAPASQQSFMSFAEALRTPSTPPLAASLADDALLQLVATVAAGEASCEQARQLLSVAIGTPERLIEADHNPAALQSSLLRNPCISDEIDDYRTLIALAFQAFEAGETEDGNRLFDQALTQAPSNTVRADLYVLRAQRQYGDPDALVELALRYDPNHGPSRFTHLRRLAQQVGTQSTFEGRINYWCLADRFRQLAASTSNATIARNARALVPQYERSAPSIEEAFFNDLEPGDTVTCSVTRSTTRVR